MTSACGVIGRPLAHSISAAFQQAAFDALGLDVRYHVWELAPEQLPDHLLRLRRPDALGCNVTIPFKVAVLDLLDGQDELVQQVGAANTLVNVGGRLVGYNSDVGGFLRALRQDGGCDPSGVAAMLLGAGGAARAVAVALLRSGVETLWLTNRSRERAEALAVRLSDGRVRVLNWHGPEFRSALAAADLVVNATPAGMLGPLVEESPLAGQPLPPGSLVFDLVANPLETRLMREARASGCRVLGGLPMLVAQGAESFQRWTGRPAPLEVMRRAAEERMRQQR